MPRRSRNVREFGFRNPGKFCLWNMKYWALKSEIQLKESGIPLKMESRIEVPLKKKKQESSTWNLESMAWNPESRLSLIEKKKRHVSSLKSVAHILSGRGRHYLQKFCGSFDKILPGL